VFQFHIGRGDHQELMMFQEYDTLISKDDNRRRWLSDPLRGGPIFVMHDPSGVYILESAACCWSLLAMFMI
jgi:hypothetical protein